MQSQVRWRPPIIDDVLNRTRPDNDGARRARFVLGFGEALAETYTRFPEPRLHHGPGYVSIVKHRDGGVDVFFVPNQEARRR